MRAKATKTFESEIFPDRQSKSDTSISIFSTPSANTKKFDKNVQSQLKKLDTRALANQQTEPGLSHIFSKKQLTVDELDTLETSDSDSGGDDSEDNSGNDDIGSDKGGSVSDLDMEVDQVMNDIFGLD